MLHRFPTLRAYMGWQFMALLEDFSQAKRRIKESIDTAALWQNFNESIDVATGMAVLPVVTLDGQRRKT